MIKDKILHLICCFIIVVIFGLMLNPISGIVIALMIALGKEAYDMKSDGTGWNWVDILADLGGIILGLPFIL